MCVRQDEGFNLDISALSCAAETGLLHQLGLAPYISQQGPDHNTGNMVQQQYTIRHWLLFKTPQYSGAL
jgi:hypothetical protein